MVHLKDSSHLEDSSFLIIGGGAFGTSTAYHLSLWGYTNVKVLDRFEVPSKEAAATDLNKIIRYDYPNPLYARLAIEAMQEWKDPAGLYKDMFQPSRWIMAAEDMTRCFLEAAVETSRASNRITSQYISAGDIKEKWPSFTGDFPGWTNLWSPDAGWISRICQHVASGEALLRLATLAKSGGAQYVTGVDGWIKELLFDSSGKCVGVRAASGATHYAAHVLLCTGANTAALLPQAKDEIIARSHCLGVIQLSPQEVKQYRSLPIIDNFEQGLFFPPDKSDRVKICSCRFITNFGYSGVPGASLGHSIEDNPGDRVPIEIEKEMRSFVKDMLPELADREWLTSRMCWDGDTHDVNFRICPAPSNPGLYVATAGSGHGFKFMPVIGKYVVDMLEGKMDSEYTELWRWRFGEKSEKTGKEPHPWPERDLSELTGWQGYNASE